MNGKETVKKREARVALWLTTKAQARNTAAELLSGKSTHNVIYNPLIPFGEVRDGEDTV
jgi:hypothetical protein